MPLPQDFFDEEVTYRIRVCMRVEDNPTLGISTGSVVGQCDRCADPIWIDENQPLPPIDDGLTLTGDVALCLPCTQWVAQSVDEKPKWIGREPEGGYPDLT